MTNSFRTNSLLKLQTFVSKYSTLEALIENLYLLAIIEAYKWIRTHDSVDGLLENDIRNKFTHNFKHHNSFLKDYINNYTIVLTKENEAYTRDETQRTDIELISPGHGNKFVIECKRLTYAEARYINGTTDGDGNHRIDGIEKFIELIYSESDGYAGMLSFIIKGRPQRITKTLKLKVKNFHCSDDIERLINQKCAAWELSFESKHIRKNKVPIHLYHLFFDFVN